MGLFGWLKKAPEIKKAEFVSPATGKIIPVDQVEDETFASKILGDGFAVELTDGEVIAPFDGEVTAAFPTGHAYGLKREDGLECLIHIGLDTVELNGSGFDVKVKQGDQVKQGQVLVKIPAKITDRVAKGVATLSQGTWYTPDENGVDTRGSINVLTSQRPTPFARGNGQHTNLVEVKKL